VSTPITVTCPDLTATKTNNVGGSVPVSAGSWTWSIHVANGGTAPASFQNTQIILTDTLPGGPTYGSAGVSSLSGITGTISCGIASNVLTCTASGIVIIAAPGSFDVSFTATASAAGAYANPSGGSCAVDPNNNVPETSEVNNSCSNTVTVVGPPTISKAFTPTSIAVGGTSTLSLTITNPNAGSALAGVAVSDTLPAGVQVASSPNASNTCNGTLTGATAGSGAISLSNGSIPAGLTCNISVDVTATSGGAKDQYHRRRQLDQWRHGRDQQHRDAYRRRPAHHQQSVLAHQHRDRRDLHADLDHHQPERGDRAGGRRCQ
jgi:hypothetical protein